MYYPDIRTAADTLPFHAARAPEAVALVCEDRAVTYRALHRAANRTAHALRAAGVTRGTRVGYLGKESEHYYVVFFACAAIGAVLVPVNWRLAPGEVAHILRDSTATVLLVEQEFAGVVEAQRAGLPSLTELVVLDRPGDRGAGLAAWVAGRPADDLPRTAGPDDAVVQLYTSGTTGLPKGVVLAHRSFFAIRDLLARHDVDWLDWRPGDRSLVSIPGFHVAGIWWAMQGLNAGVTTVCLRMFTPHDAVRAIREERITTTLAVPAMLQMMLAERDAGPADFASLRLVNYGGSPISETLLARCQEILGCDLAQMYGLTETGNCAVTLPPADHVAGSPRMRAAGRPYPGVRVKVIDGTGTEVPTGTIGEICIETPAVMLEYWGMPDVTAETLRGGWMHTGDAGYVDPDGYVFICDRIKDVVIVAGENVYPAEIENALAKHPAVAEAAVIGVPDERWGEALHAFVVPHPGRAATARELRLALRESIADFKIPTRYAFVEALPRNPSGKILRRTLREQFWAHRDRQIN